MQAKTRGLAKLAALFTLTLAVVTSTFAQTPKPADQIITLPNGEQVRFVGATWSKDAVPPYWAAHLVRMVPATVSNYLAARFRSQMTTSDYNTSFAEPRLFLWFKLLTNHAPEAAIPVFSTGPRQSLYMPYAVLSDQSGVRAGEVLRHHFYNSAEWSFIQFPVVPRRSRTLKCDIYTEEFVPYGHPVLLTSFTFENPLYGRFPHWKTEPLPAVKSSGDLQVRLETVSSGEELPTQFEVQTAAGINWTNRGVVNGWRDLSTRFEYSMRSVSGTNNWNLHSATLSDATGNILYKNAFGSIGPQTNAPAGSEWRKRNESVYDMLWPNEDAWRLKLQFKRNIAYRPEDAVTYSNVPIPALKGAFYPTYPNPTNFSSGGGFVTLPSGVGDTNYPNLAASAHGKRIVLNSFVMGPNMPDFVGPFLGGPWPGPVLKFQLPKNSEDLTVDVLSVSTDAGPAVTAGYWRSDVSPGEFQLLIRSFPTNAHFATINLIVQEARNVEFTFAPPKTK